MKPITASDRLDARTVKLHAGHRAVDKRIKSPDDASFVEKIWQVFGIPNTFTGQKSSSNEFGNKLISGMRMTTIIEAKSVHAFLKNDRLNR